MEQWGSLVVVGCSKYEASNQGVIQNAANKKALKPYITPAGYKAVALRTDRGKTKSFLVHRLVALSLLGVIMGKPIVHHVNNDRTDARLRNLEWVTSSENNCKRRPLDAKRHQCSQQEIEGEKWRLASTEHATVVPVWVSCMGRVRCCISDPDRISIGCVCGGYRQVAIQGHDARRQYKVHRLVANAFCPNVDKTKTIVNHISGDSLDNRGVNLEWVTAAENSQHSYDRVGSKRKVRAVEQYDVLNNKVGAFPSLKAACLALGIKGHGLGDACTGRSKTYHGFVWRYAE